MSESENENENDPEVGFLKCTCKECGNNIEFPATSARDTVSCPHCGEWTELVADGKEAPREEGTTVNIFALLIWVAVPLLLIGGLIFLMRHRGTSAGNQTAKPPVIKVATAPAPKSAPVPVPVETNASQPGQTSAVVEVPLVHKPKLLSDLKVGEIKIVKANEGDLRYAVGTVKNNSEYERFAVVVHVDLISVKGSKLDTATDQTDFLEPHKEWHFHAVVNDKYAVAAKFANLTEK